MLRTFRVCCILVVGAWFLPGCASEPAEDATEELPADTVAAAPAPTISLADIAGTWNMENVPETGDPTPTNYQLQVTADGVTLLLPDRDPVEAVVAVDGDSIITDAGPFESVRRAGLMVTTHTVYRLEGDRLVGTTVAHYETSDADSVLVLRGGGTRAP